MTLLFTVMVAFVQAVSWYFFLFPDISFFLYEMCIMLIIIDQRFKHHAIRHAACGRWTLFIHREGNTDGCWYLRTILSNCLTYASEERRLVARGKKGYLEGYERKNDELKLSNKYTACSQASNTRCTTICDWQCEHHNNNNNNDNNDNNFGSSLYLCFHLFTNAFCFLFLYPFFSTWEQGEEKDSSVAAILEKGASSGVSASLKCWMLNTSAFCMPATFTCYIDERTEHNESDETNQREKTARKNKRSLTLNALFSVAIILIFWRD